MYTRYQYFNKRPIQRNVHACIIYSYIFTIVNSTCKFPRTDRVWKKSNKLFFILINLTHTHYRDGKYKVRTVVYHRLW